jgi:hypothetical protein
METKRAELTISECILSYNNLRQQRVGSTLSEETMHEDQTPSLPSLPPLDQFVQIDSIVHLNSVNDQNLSVPILSAHDTLRQFDELISKVGLLDDWVQKTSQRLEEKDPITNAPRFGPKTTEKLRTMVNHHLALSLAIQYATESDDCYYDILRTIVQDLNELEIKRVNELERDATLSADNLRQTVEHEKLQSEEREKAAREVRRKEEETFFLLAEESRNMRLDKRRKEEEEEQQYEYQLLAAVTKGVYGARIQLERLKENCNCTEFTVAVKALHTLFNQIIKSPENISHRRIRRENKNFISDIGRHPGGIELLITAGFDFEIIENEKCLYLKEPDIEHDMDSWTMWFDTIKDISFLLSNEVNGRSE